MKAMLTLLCAAAIAGCHVEVHQRDERTIKALQATIDNRRADARLIAEEAAAGRVPTASALILEYRNESELDRLESELLREQAKADQTNQ